MCLNMGLYFIQHNNRNTLHNNTTHNIIQYKAIPFNLMQSVLLKSIRMHTFKYYLHSSSPSSVHMPHSFARGALTPNSTHSPPTPTLAPSINLTAWYPLYSYIVIFLHKLFCKNVWIIYTTNYTLSTVLVL